MLKSSSSSRKLLLVLTLSVFLFAAFAISGFTIAGVEGQTDYLLPPNEGPGAPPTGGEGDDQENGAEVKESAEPVNVIENGGFEEPFVEFESVAPQWELYSNGQAWFGWYEETWPEAVRSGEQAQLMEIFAVEANVQSRVIAIHQTTDVAPDSTYDLEFYAIMRTQAPPTDRNRNEFEMHWGIDYSGEGDYENVLEWNLIPLEEQFREGSNGEYPDDVPLFYEVVTGTVETGESSKITLFIRGLKKFSVPTEVNFDVDDVSLVGPPPGPIVIVTPEPVESEQPAETPSEEEATMPESGAILPENVPAGPLVLGGLVLVVLGVSAAAGMLHNNRKGA